MLTFALITAFLSGTAYALPSLLSRQSAACGALGSLTSYDNATDFSLAAWNTTLPNSNNTGVPLVLASNNVNSNPQASTVLATYASFPEEFWPGPAMTLINGALIPAPRGGFVAYDVNVTAGYALGFAVTNPQNAKPGAEIYCIQDVGAPTGFQHALLAVHGDTEYFSLCNSISTGPEQPLQNQVIYKATADNNAQYDFDSCYAVRIQIVAAL